VNDERQWLYSRNWLADLPDPEIVTQDLPADVLYPGVEWSEARLRRCDRAAWLTEGWCFKARVDT
jgi:hypothetical protein